MNLLFVVRYSKKRVDLKVKSECFLIFRKNNGIFMRTLLFIGTCLNVVLFAV